MCPSLKGLLLGLVVITLATPLGVFQSAEAASDGTTWTIMIYMSANADPELPWLENLNQIEAAVQAAGTTILALVDPYGGGNTTLYRIAHDPGGVNAEIVSSAIEDGGAVIPTSTHNANMGSGTTLSSFIEFSASNYPADRLVLMLWGHGAGWRGYCPDGTDLLTLQDLKTALSGKVIDLLAIDACAGATIETLFEIRSYVRYLVASENDVPSEGLPYRAVFDALASNVNVTASDFGRTIVQKYMSWSRNYSSYSATMALFDLDFANMQPFVEQFHGWAYTARWLEGLFHTELRSTYQKAEKYGTESQFDWQFDFGSVLSHLQSSSLPEELKVTSRRVLESYLQLIVYASSFDNPDDDVRVKEATGAVIYCPNGTAADSPYWNLTLKSYSWTQFANMLRRTATSNTSEPGPALSYSTEENYGVGRFDTVTLTWPTSYPEILVWVFRESANGLVPCAEIRTNGTIVTIHGGDAIGSLIISASAGASGFAESYAKSGPVSLAALITMNLTLSGMSPEGGLVHVTMNTSAGVVFANATDYGSHGIQIQLLTPWDLWLGDLVEIQVNTEDGLVGSEEAWVNSTSVNVTIDLHEKPPPSRHWTLYVGMAALAVALIAIFVILMHLESRKQPP